jgi:phosphatidylglycerol---prolipoprotein diacylglyceryl transferase
MHPIMFRWRGITVHSYPAMQWLGLTLGVLAGDAAARASGLDAFRVFVATILLLFPALAGARVLHVAINWGYYRERPRSIWDTRKGGAAQYGGILVAVPLSIPLLRALGVPFAAFWDVAGITIMVGMMFTRIGCFLNGCCEGRECSSRIAMHLPNTRGEWKRRYPTQLFEAAWAAALLAVGLSLWRSLPFDGALFVFIASGYALGRLVMESMRDTRRAFTVHHAISILIILVSLAALTTRGPQ